MFRVPTVCCGHQDSGPLQQWGGRRCHRGHTKGIQLLSLGFQPLSPGQLSCDPTDCSPPGSSVLGIFQAKILGQVAISFSRGSSQPRNRTLISCIGRRVLYHWASLIGQLVKNPPEVQVTPLWVLGRGDPLQKGQATHSSILGFPLWLSW